MDSDFDVFIPTYYGDYFRDYLEKPFVLIVHDMIHEKFPEYFQNVQQYVPRNKHQMMLEADRILTVSGNTRDDIMEFYPELTTQIDVMHLAYSPPASTKRFVNSYGDYLLYVGNRSVYKNFTFFVDSVADMLVDRRLQILCVGSGPFDQEESALLMDLKITESVHHLPYDESTLPAIYAQAVAFVFPSRYEGFGIPNLEAFANECPVILSNASSFPEVAGNAALYFEIDEPSFLVASVERLIVSPELRGIMIKNGQKRLQDFTWDHAGKVLFDAISEIVA